MDTPNYSPKDAKIIRENPDKTPYGLLGLGLSNAAYNRMMANQPPAASTPTPDGQAPTVVDAPTAIPSAEGNSVPATQPGQDLTAVPVVTEAANVPAAASTQNVLMPSVVDNAPATPQLSTYERTAGESNLKTRIVIGPLGPRRMNANYAAGLVRRLPKEYKFGD